MNLEPLSWSRLAAMSPMEAASALVDRIESGVEPDNALTDRWLDASEENRRAWIAVRDAWDGLEGWEAEPALVAMREEALRVRRSAPTASWRRYAAAACVTLAVSTAGLLALRTSQHGGPLTPQIASAGDTTRFGLPDLIAPADRTLRAALPDGSRVVLSPGSAVDLAFAGGARLARLDRGAAALEVRHDAASPFRLGVGTRIVVDVGTTFEVGLKPDEVRVHLIEGAVAVFRGNDPARPSGDALRLRPGEELVAGPSGDDVRHPASATKAAPATISFDDETLASVVARMNRYDRVRLVVASPAVGAIRVSGSFHTGDANRFVRTLSTIYPVRVRPMPRDVLVIESAGRK